MLWWMSVVALGAPDGDALREALETHRTAIEAFAVYPLDFSDKELARAAAGQVAKRRERLRGADRVVGMIWAPVSIDAMWAAMRDIEHKTTIDGFYGERFPDATHVRNTAYQSIDFPWPFADRQWVIELNNNVELFLSTKGAILERSWDVSPRRGAQGERDDAVWVEINDGSWFVASAAGGTLLAYQVRSVVGGSIPDDLATRWAMGALSGNLQGAVDRAASMPSHYRVGHAPILRPDGTLIPPW